MAIRRLDRQCEMLQAPTSRAAGIVSSVLSLMAIAGILAILLGDSGQPTAAKAFEVCLIALFGLALAAGVHLLGRKAWAQKFLLVFWGTLATVALVLMTASLLYDFQQWWPDVLYLPFTAILAIVVAVSAVAASLVALASAGGSRLRYGTLVSVSIMVTIAVVVLVNLIAHNQPSRIDVQTLGRYGLSQRSKKILKAVGDNIRLTCVYTASDDATVSQYRPRTLEYLDEMREQMRTDGPKIEVHNVTTDAQKDRLIARLWDQMSGKSTSHLAMLQEFLDTAVRLNAGLQSESQRWAAISPTSNLGTWGLPVQISDRLERNATAIERTRLRIESQLTERAGLPDAQLLTRQAIDVIDAAEDALRKSLTELKNVQKIPPTIQANRDDALRGLAEALAAAEDMGRAIGAEGDPIPPKASGLLSRFVTAAEKAGALASEAAGKLEEIAGKENISLLAQSPVWQIHIQAGPEVLLRTTLSRLVAIFAENISRMKLSAEGLVKAAKEDHIKEVLPEWRKEVAQFTAQLQKAAEGVENAVDMLTSIDEQTEQIFAELSDKKLFAQLTEPMRAWLKEARALPELETTSLSTDITQDNIVIVEIGDKAEVVHFDAVWPEKIPQLGGRRAEGEPQRTFNGDSAISSRILAMTSEPFATVLMTYFRPNVPPQIEGMLPLGLEPKHMSILQDRLREANFQVKEWNLTDDMPEADENEKARPTVLLIMPPGPPIMSQLRQRVPQFGREHEEKIRGAIDAGLPAIFLSHYSWPQEIAPRMPPISPPYAFRSYLHEDWGIDVRSDYRVMSMVPHPSLPGKFMIDRDLLRWMAIAGFTDHVIAKPLQAQRTMWADLCPVELAADEDSDSPGPEKGVTVSPLLRVPAGVRQIWATNRIMELGQELYKSPTTTVEPNYERGDMPAPFDVALAATRIANPEAAQKPARIVVLPIAMSLVNGYLGAKIPVSTQGGTTLTDAPRANADLVVNSAYWLAGYERYIAAGPVRIQPVAMVDSIVMKSLWSLCVVVLPAGVLIAGAVVMISRRRR